MHHLQPDFGKGTKDTVQTLLTYHSFRKQNEKIGQDTKPVETALKSIALKIAEQDIVYAKRLEAFCDTVEEGSYFKDLNCKALWEDLKLAAPNLNRTLFLFLDGLDQLSDKSAKKLLKVLKELRYSPKDSEQTLARVLVSSRADTFQDDLLPATPIVNIEKYNQPEIELCISRELEERQLLQSEEIKRLIHGKLPRAVQGNFSKVDTALDKVSEVVASDETITDLEKVLSEAGQDWELIAKNVINELTEQLSAKEIDELNELLIWMIFGYEYFDAKQLQAALVSLAFPASFKILYSSTAHYLSVEGAIA